MAGRFINVPAAQITSGEKNTSEDEGDLADFLIQQCRISQVFRQKRLIRTKDSKFFRKKVVTLDSDLLY